MNKNIQQASYRLAALIMGGGLIMTIMLTGMLGFTLFFHQTQSLEDRASSLLVFTFLSGVVLLFSFVGLSMILRAIRKAQQPRSPSAHAHAWPFTQNEATAWMLSIVHEVEQEAGCTFRCYPTVRLVDWLEVGALLAEEMGHPKPARSNDLSDRLLELTAIQASLRFTPYMIGKYGKRTQEIYLLPENVERLLKEADLGQDILPDVIKLTIAHELVHALQDQEIGLSTHLKSNDPMAPFHLAIEGQAMVVQALVAKKLNLEELEATLANLAMQHDDQADGVRMADIYRAGVHKMSAAQKKGGQAAMWELVRSSARTKR